MHYKDCLYKPYNQMYTLINNFNHRYNTLNRNAYLSMVIIYFFSMTMRLQVIRIMLIFRPTTFLQYQYAQLLNIFLPNIGNIAKQQTDKSVWSHIIERYNQLHSRFSICSVVRETHSELHGG